MESISIMKLLHLAGLIMGLGGAVLADYTTWSRGVIRPVSAYTIYQMQFLSRIVLAGLVLLWVSGAGLIWLGTMNNPDYLTNEKLWAKLLIVVVLTINGVVVHRFVMPYLRDSIGRRLFENVGKVDIALLTMVGSLSFVSWMTPFVLAKATELNYVTPFRSILVVYLSIFAIAWLGSFALINGITLLQAMARSIAVKAYKPNKAWEHSVGAE